MRSTIDLGYGRTGRATFAKVLNDNHVSTTAYNDHMRMINRTYVAAARLFARTDP